MSVGVVVLVAGVVAGMANRELLPDVQIFPRTAQAPTYTAQEQPNTPEARVAAVESNTPSGRTSSTATTIPNVVTPQQNSSGRAEPATKQPSQTVTTPIHSAQPAKSRTVVGDGFTIALSASEKLIREDGGVFSVKNVAGTMRGRIEKTSLPFGVQDIQTQLAASSSITNISETTRGSYRAFTYTVDTTVPGLVVVAGSIIYYVWDYAGLGLAETFMVQ
jgi:hypothetical protein